MPMLTIVAHLALVDSDGLATIVTIFGKHCVEAMQTIRLAIAHYVPLTPQLFVTFEARKVFHVPRATLCLCAFVR